MAGIERNILRNVLKRLRDFASGADRGSCFLYELSGDKHRTIMDIIRLLREEGVINGYDAAAFIGDEIDLLIKFIEHWKAESFYDYYYGPHSDEHPSLEEDILSFDCDMVDGAHNELFGIDEKLNGATPEEYDERNGTSFSEEIYKLVHFSRNQNIANNVIGVDEAFGEQYKILTSEKHKTIMKDPLRTGFKVISVNQEKLREFCKRNKIRLSPAPQEKKIYARLSFSEIGQPQVYLDDVKYIGVAFKSQSEAAKVVEYIFRNKKHNQKITTEELKDNGVLSSQKKNLKVIFRNSPLNAERSTGDNTALSPFAVILEPSAIQISDRIMLTKKQARNIKKNLKKK